MLNLPIKFLQAFRRTCILLATVLLMLMAWAGLRMPYGNLLILIFAFLSAVRISDFASPEIRLRMLGELLAGVIILQYVISITHNIHWLNILLPTAVCGIILHRLPAASAYLILLTGLQAYTAEPGAFAAMERSADILLAGGIAYFISFSAAGKKDNDLSPEKPPERNAAVEKTITVFCAIFLYKILDMPQGIWIVLTIIFIYIAQPPGEESGKLVQQRILSVPAGIILGGLYSGALTAFDYRIVYLAPLIGATGFFMLYYRHDFFRFSLLFMVAFTVCADWLAGTAHEFNFLQLLMARSLATLTGAVVLIIVKKAAAYRNSTISAT